MPVKRCENSQKKFISFRASIFRRHAMRNKYYNLTSSPPLKGRSLRLSTGRAPGAGTAAVPALTPPAAGGLCRAPGAPSARQRLPAGRHGAGPQRPRTGRSRLPRACGALPGQGSPSITGRADDRPLGRLRAPLSPIPTAA